jgi:hypothetical protein
VALISVALAIWTVVTTLLIMRLSHSALPLSDAWDYWRWYPRFQKNFWELFAQHNEHRIVLPRILFLIDQFIFGATDTFLLVAIFLTQCGHAVLLWRVTLRSGRWTRPGTFFLLGVVLTLLLSAQQYTNLITGFQVQFIAVFFLATLSLLALERAQNYFTLGRPTDFRLWFAVSILAAIGATGCMANGLFVWVLLLVFGLWWRIQWRYTLIIWLLGTLTWVLYFWHYQTPSAHSSPTDAWLHAPNVLAFATAYLGSPVDDSVLSASSIYGTSNASRAMWASLVGLIGLMTALRCAIMWIQDRSRFAAARGVLVGQVLFVVISAFATASGRLTFPLIDALQWRYMTPALIFWACLLFLLWSYRKHVRPLSEARWMGLVVCALAILVAVHQPSKFRYAVGYRAHMGAAESAVAAGIQDDELLKDIYHTPALIWEPADYFRAHAKSIFGEPWYRWYGTKLEQHYKVKQNAGLKSFVDGFRRVGQGGHVGWHLWGWAWDGSVRFSPSRVLFTTADNRILGFGGYGQDRADVSRANAEIRYPWVGWNGYVADQRSDTLLYVYLMSPNGAQVLPVGSIKLPGRVDVVPFRTGDTPIQGVPISILGTWSVNGYFPEVGHPPVSAPIYGSWAGDAATGTIRFGPFRVSGAVALVLPLVTGPSTEGLSLEVRNARTHTALYELAPIPVTREWILLRVPIPLGASTEALEVVATDSGRGWGQWFAIGSPETIKGI